MIVAMAQDHDVNPIELAHRLDNMRTIEYLEQKQSRSQRDARGAAPLAHRARNRHDQAGAQ